MDDFFKKEITPFARVTFGSESDEIESDINWIERWKFMDTGVYNRAVKVQWNMISNLPVGNWTEFQRKVKHLIATRLEFDTIMDWIAEDIHQGNLNLIKLPEGSDTTPLEKFFDFWTWDQEIFQHGARACNFDSDESWKRTLDDIMISALQEVLNKNTNTELIAMKKQFNEILKEIYDLIICTCPWDGKIMGGPLLPNQSIEVALIEGRSKITCKFEFSILGARARDFNWLKDLKFPTLSPTSQIWIHHGASRKDAV